MGEEVKGGYGLYGKFTVMLTPRIFPNAEGDFICVCLAAAAFIVAALVESSPEGNDESDIAETQGRVAKNMQTS